MTIQKFLETSTVRLKQSGIATARLDCLVLLEDATGRDRAWLLAHPNFAVQGSTLYRLNRQVKRRAEHEPLAYIRGETQFYGREFIINKNVLEPRPETETMIDLLRELADSRQLTDGCSIVDVGTGSGALAVTVKLESPKTDVIATDIDPNCLKVARRNAKNFNLDISFLHGNLLEPLEPTPNLYDRTNSGLVVLANLPYVPDNYELNEAAKYEPRLAIFGGQDGLDLYQEMFAQIQNFTTKPAYVFTESLPFQHAELAKIAANAGYIQLQAQDLIQIFKHRP